MGLRVDLFHATVEGNLDQLVVQLLVLFEAPSALRQMKIAVVADWKWLVHWDGCLWIVQKREYNLAED